MSFMRLETRKSQLTRKGIITLIKLFQSCVSVVLFPFNIYYLNKINRKFVRQVLKIIVKTVQYALAGDRKI